MPASWRLRAYSAAVVLARDWAMTIWPRSAAVKLLTINATTKKTNSATAFSASAIVKV